MFLVDLLTTSIDSIQESPGFIQSCANEVVTSGELRVVTEAKLAARSSINPTQSLNIHPLMMKFTSSGPSRSFAAAESIKSA